MVDTSPHAPTTGQDRAGLLQWDAGLVALSIAVPSDAAPYLAGVAVQGGPELHMPAGLPLVDVLLVSRGHDPASDRLVHGSLGDRLRYVEHETHLGPDGHRLEVSCESDIDGLLAVVSLRVAAGTSVIQSKVTVFNHHDRASSIVRSVPSFSSYLGAPANTDPDVRAWTITRGFNDWLGEGRWVTEVLNGSVLPSIASELTGHNPRGAITWSSDSTWSTGRHLPVGLIESEAFGAVWAWQVEHNGPWRFELGEDHQDGYLALSGPTDTDHQFTRVLLPGESFTTVPVAVTIATDRDTAIGALTRYRRAMRRVHPDNTAMPVIFNDYMNTLNGDPTTEKLLPLIDAAAQVGAEIFCIDAGWYDDGGDWWDSVGQWTPSTTRFPGGLSEVVDRITAAGMTPGLWLEPEVVGINSPIASKLPEAAFLSRHGQRIVEHERYLLDLRHPAAIAHLDEVVDRLVQQFGVGYFKLDYNVTPGAGTDLSADSVGSGLLDHTRAHLAWLDAVLDRHPGLVLENCASGAMRSDFAMLSRLQLQSTSDQQDPLKYPPIAVAAPMVMLPEQAASWAYPQPAMSLEESAFALTTGLVGRFFLSGYLNNMTDAQRSLVTDAVTTANELAPHIRSSTPSWPLGLPGWDDPVVALALDTDDSTVLAVWDRAGGASITYALPQLTGIALDPRTLFPTVLTDWTITWDADTAQLSIRNPTEQPGARLFRLTLPPG